MNANTRLDRIEKAAAGCGCGVTVKIDVSGSKSEMDVMAAVRMMISGKPITITRILTDQQERQHLNWCMAEVKAILCNTPI